MRALARHHPRRRRRRRRERADDFERGHLGCAGSAGHAAGPDAARHVARRRRASLRRAGALHRPEGRRPVGRLHARRADLRDGDRRAAVRRRHAAGAAGQDAERRAPRDPRELQPSLPDAAAAAIQTALSSAPEKRFASAREFLAAFAAGERRLPASRSDSAQIRSVPRPDDRIHLRVLQRLVQQIPVTSPSSDRGSIR